MLSEDRAATWAYEGWSLPDAIDALMAHDHSATDSGIADPDLKAAVRDHLTSLDVTQFRRVCAEFARRLLTDEGIARGYGVEDVVSFWNWPDDEQTRR